MLGRQVRKAKHTRKKQTSTAYGVLKLIARKPPRRVPVEEPADEVPLSALTPEEALRLAEVRARADVEARIGRARTRTRMSPALSLSLSLLSSLSKHKQKKLGAARALVSLSLSLSLSRSVAAIRRRLGGPRG